ncbi:MAG: TorF family putative porin [Proteobacteria bacterium]|nr:TorF family putative porin [Pseudomonadota bacterium]
MKSTKTILIGSLLAACGLAQADWSANVGYASEYHYRGILQKNSSASGGLDYESGGFYAGAWAADVGDGLEVDGYFGYGADVGDLGLSIGYTGYFYTGDFDDTYQEINLGAGFGVASLDVAIGKYDNFDGPELDYTFVSLTVESKSGLYGTLGSFSQDFDGDYLELGYGTSLADFDLGVALIFANDDLVGDDEESLVFTIGKSFDL